MNGKNADKPNFSHTLFKNNILKEIEGEEPVFLFLIDNLRLDQWKVLQPIITEFYKVEREETYCSILPTATQYARNAFFSGLLPLEMEKRFPQQWKNDDVCSPQMQLNNSCSPVSSMPWKLARTHNAHASAFKDG